VAALRVSAMPRLPPVLRMRQSMLYATGLATMPIGEVFTTPHGSHGSHGAKDAPGNVLGAFGLGKLVDVDVLPLL
jgi:hypothetical protein